MDVEGVVVDGATFFRTSWSIDGATLWTKFSPAYNSRRFLGATSAWLERRVREGGGGVLRGVDVM